MDNKAAPRESRALLGATKKLPPLSPLLPHAPLSYGDTGVGPSTMGASAADRAGPVVAPRAGGRAGGRAGARAAASRTEREGAGAAATGATTALRGMAPGADGSTEALEAILALAS